MDYSFSNLFKRIKPIVRANRKSASRSRKNSRLPHKLRLELLEDRVVPTTLPATDIALAVAPLPSGTEGGDLVYNVMIQNNGPADGVHVVLTDNIPAGTSFVSSNFSSGVPAFSGGTFTLTIPLLTSGSSVTGTIDLRATEEGTVNNTLTITADNPDTDPANDSAMITTAVSDAQLNATGVNVAATEGTNTGTVTVATFTDLGGAEPVGDYSATIDWGGPGTGSTTGNVIANGDGSFSVQGNFAYTDEGSDTISVHIVHDGSITADTTSMATVSDAALNATGVNVNATEGTNTGAVTVATFTDLGGSEVVGHYSATINWGGAGTGSSTGTIVDNGDGTFSVRGSFAYADEGSFTVAVHIVHENGITADTTSTATVTDAALSAAGVDVTATEGISTGAVTVATFMDLGGPEVVGHYSATIDWGGAGTGSTVGTIVNSGGVFSVRGSFTYTDEGSFTIAVHIVHENGITADTTSTATVSDAALTATGVDVAATEGTNTGTVDVATFTDLGGQGVETAAGDFSATIDWGGAGTGSTAGMIVGNDNGSYSVRGSFAYLEEGSFTVSVHIVHENGITADTTSTASVSDAALTATGVDVTAIEGANTGTVTVATFTDLGGQGLETAAGDFSATINWGGAGTGSTVGTVVDNGNGSYTVQGNFSYVEEGSYTVSVHIVHENGITADTMSTATVADAGLTAMGVNVTVVEGANTGIVTVATFTDLGGQGLETATGDFSAMINWGGAGTGSSTGTISGNGDGSYIVQGNFTYLEEGSYTVSVHIVHENGITADTMSTATVSDPAVVATGGFTVTGRPTCDTGPMTVATFTDPGGAEPLSEYSASINWGDNTPTSAGTISFNPNGAVFTVQGNHTYNTSNPPPFPHTFAIAVTISHGTAADVVVNDSALINDVLNYTANPNAAIIIDLVADTISSTGGPTVSLCGIAILNLMASGVNSMLTYLGTSADEGFSYTPSDATSGTVSLPGGNMVATFGEAAFTVNFTGIGSTFTLNPDGGANTIAVHDTIGNDTTVVAGNTVQVGGTKTITYVAANTQHLTVSDDSTSPDVFVVNRPAAPDVSIDGSSGGADTFRIQETLATSNLTINGKGNMGVDLDQVTIGNAGRLDGIQGAVTVNNIGGTTLSGYTNLTVDDSADPSSWSAIMMDSVLGTIGSRFALIHYTNVGFLTVNGGTAGNVFFVLSTPNSAVTLNTGTGLDTVHVVATSVGSTLTINGQGSTGAGFDQVTIGNAGRLDGIQGAVTVSNIGGTTLSGYTDLTVDDSRDPVSWTAIMSSSALGTVGSRFALMNYTNAGSLTVNGGTAGNIFFVLGTPNSAVTLNTGTGLDTVHVVGTAVGSTLTVNAQGTTSALDRVIIGSLPSSAGSLTNIQGAITVNDIGGTSLNGYTDLTVDDSADTMSWSAIMMDSVLGTIGSRFALIHYSNVGFFTVDGGRAGNGFFVLGTPNSLVTFNTGVGQDTSDVRHAAAGSTLTINGDGSTGASDQVALGMPVTGTSRSVQQIQGMVTVNNNGGTTLSGYTNLSVDDSGDTIGRGTAANPITISDTQIASLAPALINYSNLAILAVNGGSGGNQFTVTNTPNAMVILNSGMVSDMVNVRATAGGSTLSIDGQAGADSLMAGNTSHGVQDIHGAIAITNTAGATGLTVDDAHNAVVATNATIDAASARPGSANLITGLAPGNITYGNLSSLTVNGGMLNERFTATDTPTGIPTALIGGLGSDQYVINNTHGVVNQVVGGAAGSTTFVHATSAPTNLLGGAGNDTFSMMTGVNGNATLSGGIIDGGGGGMNMIDYSAYGSGVLVNLTPQTGTVNVTNTLMTVTLPPAFSGTGVMNGSAGGVSHIQMGVGSSLPSTLAGGIRVAGNHMILKGGSGNDSIVAFGDHNVLIGNGGTDTLFAQGIGNVLYAGNLNDLIADGAFAPGDNGSDSTHTSQFHSTLVTNDEGRSSRADPASLNVLLINSPADFTQSFLTLDLEPDGVGSIDLVASHVTVGPLSPSNPFKYPDVINELLMNPPTPTSPVFNRSAITMLGSAATEANIVNSYYQQFLQRSADTTGLASAASFLATGGGHQALISGILASDEYFQLHASTNAGFVRGLYHDLLNRVPSQTEVDGWLALVPQVGRLAVATDFLTSPEYLNSF